MGTRQLRILPYTGKRAYQYYIDGLKVNAKRQRLFFKDEKSAKAKLKELTNKTRKEGEDALALSHDFRVLAAKCSERLKPFSRNLYARATGEFVGGRGSFPAPSPRVTSVRRITDSRGAAPGMVGRRSRPRSLLSRSSGF